MQIYIVRPGDTLWAIAARFSLSPERLAYTNQLNDPSKLAVGMALLIPTAAGAPDKSMSVNAYAYPNIAQSVLEEYLPCLSYICPFTHMIDIQGRLSPLNDAILLEKAAQKLHIKGCCAACLNPMEQQAEITKNATDIPEDVPLFMLPGAYHPQKLRGMYKWMMKLVTKILVKKISANENKGEAEEKMLSVLSDGGSFVQPEHLTQVIKWLQAE